MPIRVLVVDDHNIVREGLTFLLKQYRDIEVVGGAANGAEAVKLARDLHPDVVLMDLLMPIMDGIEATTLIKRELPEIEVIALTSVLEDASVVEAVKAGAIGYLLKDRQAADLYQAIKAASTGQVQLTPEAIARLLRGMRSPEQPKPLTEREKEVLALLAQGLSNREIADKLKIGEKTVSTHVSNIMEKIGVQSRTQAALYAINTGLVKRVLA